MQLLSSLRRLIYRSAGLWALASCLSFIALPSMAANVADCVVQCGSESCGVNGNDPIEQRKTLRIEACSSATITHGTVLGVFQTPHGLERFRVTETKKPFATLIPALAGATCLVGRSCIEDRELRRTAGIGGKGADEDRIVHDGRPCELGLPCGLILKPKQTLQIQTTDIPGGKFTLTGKRGADKSSASFDLRDGRIELPAEKLVASGVYTYTLQGASGAPAVRGEFSVMSTKMQRDVEQEVDKERHDHPDEAMLREIGVLLEEDLQWDASQLLK